MLAEHSLFASLHKWARGQDENFCTEGLIYLLKSMLRESPTQALEITSWLTDRLIGVGDVPQAIVISSQVSGAEGRPDIEIVSGTKIATIEVKVDSKVEVSQLKRYRCRHDGKPGETRLVLLSRGNDKLQPDNLPDCSRRWLDLSLRLRGVLETLSGKLSKTSIILQDYLAFLGIKQMSLEAVSISPSRSISDVATILTQLKLAIERLEGVAKRGWNEKTTALGCSISLSGEPFGWVGFNLFEPQWLFYTTEGAKDEVKINFDLARNCKLPGACIVGDHWTNSIDLSDCRDYLDATAADQVEYVHRHIEESLRAFHAMIPSPAPDS